MTSGEEEGKSGAAMADPPRRPQPYPYQFEYGTFGAPDYSQPVIGIPQPVAPSGVGAVPAPPVYLPSSAGAHRYTHGYHTVPVYAAVAEIRPLRLRRLPCCGMGLGWFLFIAGFLFAAIPWYIGAFILLCVRVDFREKPGFVACTIAAILFAIAVFFGAKNDAW